MYIRTQTSLSKVITNGISILPLLASATPNVLLGTTWTATDIADAYFRRLDGMKPVSGDYSETLIFSRIITPSPVMRAAINFKEMLP